MLVSLARLFTLGDVRMRVNLRERNVHALTAQVSSRFNFEDNLNPFARSNSSDQFVWDHGKTPLQAKERIFNDFSSGSKTLSITTSEPKSGTT